MIQTRESEHLAAILRSVRVTSAALQQRVQSLAFVDALKDALVLCALVLLLGAMAALLVRHREGSVEAAMRAQ